MVNVPAGGPQIPGGITQGQQPILNVSKLHGDRRPSCLARREGMQAILVIHAWKTFPKRLFG